MLVQFFKTAARNRVPALSFMQEFCAVAGAGAGLTMIATAPTTYAPIPFGPMHIYMNTPIAAAMVYVGISKLVPLLANWADATAQEKEPSIDHYFPTHNHTPSRLAGIAAGAILSASMAVGFTGLPFQGNTLHLQPLMNKGTEIMTVLGGIAEKAYPRLDLALKNQMN